VQGGVNPTAQGTSAIGNNNTQKSLPPLTPNESKKPAQTSDSVVLRNRTDEAPPKNTAQQRVTPAGPRTETERRIAVPAEKQVPRKEKAKPKHDEKEKER
jgi:hypothetical protein